MGGKSALNTRMHATFRFDIQGGNVKELAEAARLAIGHLLASGQTLEDDVTWELDDIRINIATTSDGERTIRTWAAVVRGSIVVPGV